MGKRLLSSDGGRRGTTGVGVQWENDGVRPGVDGVISLRHFAGPLRAYPPGPADDPRW